MGQNYYWPSVQAKDQQIKVKPLLTPDKVIVTLSNSKALYIPVVLKGLSLRPTTLMTETSILFVCFPIIQ